MGDTNISINTVNQSPNANSTTRKHTFKRVERILDSSDEDSPPPPPLACIEVLSVVTYTQFLFVYLFLYLFCENS